MADETSTANSTTTDQTAATSTDATATADQAQSTATDQAAETVATDVGSTALGGGADDQAATTDEAAAAPVIPEAYELAAPEGFEKLDDETVAAATPVFKELGLTNEQANKLMPVAGEFAKRIVAERDQQFLGTILEQRKGWLNDARADKEIGGQNWDGSMQASARALDQLGFPKGSPLRSALDESGFGNHPELIRLMARVGKAIGEDSDFVRGDANAAVKPKSDAELFYGSKKD